MYSAVVDCIVYVESCVTLYIVQCILYTVQSCVRLYIVCTVLC